MSLLTPKEDFRRMEKNMISYHYRVNFTGNNMTLPRLEAYNFPLTGAILFKR